MVTDREFVLYLKEADERIDWVLAHPAMSDWLKGALVGARRRDPVDLLVDLGLLDYLLTQRAELQIADGLTKQRR